MSNISNIIVAIYNFLWGDLITLNFKGTSIGIPLLVILLIPTGIYFTVRTRFMPIRKLPQMVRALCEKKDDKSNLSTFQTLIVSTATRVGMGNLVGVVAAVSAGGAGAIFWMWVTALIGSSTAFIEATLAQIHKEKDPLYGGFRGGPAYYIHDYVEGRTGKKRKCVLPAVLFAISGLICWCGISQVISNSVAASFKNAFSIPPLYTTIVLVILAAIIVLRKNATVKVLDLMVPFMAVCYFCITIFIIITNIGSLPGVFARIFQEAFGIRQVAAGGFGAVLMNGVKRGLFSNEAGSGSAPCAAAAAECDKPVKAGLTQALGVFVDTIVICTLTALVILCSGVPIGYGEAAGAELTILGFTSTYGSWVSIFTAVAMCCFAFSTIIGWGLYGTRCIEFLFGTKINKPFMVLYSLVAIVGATMDLGLMWNIAETFNGLMAIPNLIAVFLLSGVVVKHVKEYFAGEGKDA